MLGHTVFPSEGLREVIPDQTRPEEQGPVFVKEIIEGLPKPKPAYNTVSTVVRILEQKGFVGHEAFGRSHRYYALITQEEYSKNEMDKMLTDHFEGSKSRMLSFFMEENDMSMDELNEIMELIKKKRDA